MEWHPAGWLGCLPLLISPCTIKSRSSLLAPAHPGGPGKKGRKRLWWCGYSSGTHAGHLYDDNDDDDDVGPVYQPCPAPPAALPRRRQTDPAPCDRRPGRSAAAASRHACPTALEICSTRPGVSHRPTVITVTAYRLQRRQD